MDLYLLESTCHIKISVCMYSVCNNALMYIFDGLYIICSLVHIHTSLLADGQSKPLLQGITDETAILPLTQGVQHHVFAAAVDKVGNMQSLGSAMSNAVQVNITTVEVSCLNDCSGQGSCTAIGTCQCQSGFYGSDCSQGTVVLRNTAM